MYLFDLSRDMIWQDICWHAICGLELHFPGPDSHIIWVIWPQSGGQYVGSGIWLTHIHTVTIWQSKIRRLLSTVELIREHRFAKLSAIVFFAKRNELYLNHFLQKLKRINCKYFHEITKKQFFTTLRLMRLLCYAGGRI